MAAIGNDYEDDGQHHSDKTPCAEIGRAKYVFIQQTYMNKHDETEIQKQNDLIIALISEIIERLGKPSLPLYGLEQEICHRLSEIQNTEIPSFIHLMGVPFLKFLEEYPATFNIKKSNDIIMISRNRKPNRELNESDREPISTRPKSKSGTNTQTKKKTEESYDELSDFYNDTEWSCVQRKKSRGVKGPAPPPSPLKSASENRVAVPDVQRTSQVESSFIERALTSQMESSFIERVLTTQACNKFILKMSHKEYMNDRVSFIQDVVSLWNTPRPSNAYVIIGIEQRSAIPHLLLGLQGSKEAEVYKDMIPASVFQAPPLFTYREVSYDSKLVGIIEVENNKGKGTPSVVISDDLAPRLKKDQLWARKDCKNVVVLPSDPLYKKIFHVFGSHKTASQVNKSIPEVSARDGLTIADCSLPTNALLFSSVVKQSNPNESSVMKSKSKESGTQLEEPGEVKALLKCLNFFKKGHFVLMCGSTHIDCMNVEALARAPWMAVYDFDFRGRDSGLLANMEESLRKRRNLSVLTWLNPVSGLTERGTQWWSLRGQRAVPDSLTSETSHIDWFKSVQDKLEKICLELARFITDYTVLTIFVLWPYPQLEAGCMRRFLIKMQDFIVQLPLILCFVDPGMNSEQSNDVKSIREDFKDSIKTFHVRLGDLCLEIENIFPTCEQENKFAYKLPIAESSEVCIIRDEEAAWLSQDLEVLYMESPYTRKDLSAEDLTAEADNFFRGGTIPWFVWYDVGAGYLDVERCNSETITKHIQTTFLKEYKGGAISIFHAPGSGGSTMAQRILWDLHKEAPCVHIKQRSGSSTEDVAARINLLYDKTQLPVVALLDGEDEARVKQLTIHVPQNNIVIVSVKRYPYPIEESRLCVPSKNTFYLRGSVNKQESRNLVLRFNDRCDSENKKEALKKLNSDVQNSKSQHQMFEYGMTVYNHEFKGVHAYVKGHLELKQRSELQAWHKCLGYLALVYYYGQSSLPCQFLARILGKPQNVKVDVEDLPYQMRVFVVTDVNEARGQYIRIGHYVIAKEILEQILNRSDQKTLSRGSSELLSKEARRNLKEFCIEFIELASKRRAKTSAISQTIIQILVKTFIYRDNRNVTDTEAQPKRKPQFSPLLTDIDSNPPYNGRLEVMKKLCDAFPDEPNFRAHLGRFYACCRPEEDYEAEKHLSEALKLCMDRSKGKPEESEIDDGTRLTLMHVYHMYGMVYSNRVNKTRKKKESLEGHEFKERFDSLVSNASKACEHFLKCREYTPLGYEDSYKYMDEIFVRLKTCDFVKQCFAGGMCAFLSKRNCDAPNFQFILDCVTEIQDLIMECYSVVLLDTIDSSLKKALLWFNSLFQECTAELKELGVDDDVASRRLRITVQKLEFRNFDSILSVETPVSPHAIEKLVSMLESVFQQNNTYGGIEKRKLEVNYRDWLQAIRNTNLRTKVYSLEHVLGHVRQWHESVQSPMSIFYLFVLLSLLGFGSSKEPGNTECLLEATELLQENLKKLSKTVFHPRRPREWLGRDSLEGIRRLISHKTVGHVDQGRIKDTRLAVCKGTIRHKNDNKRSGYIDLDLGENTTPVRAFYIPLMAGLEGKRNAGQRVQFHVAFTLENGYEAYEVKLLEKLKCEKCNFMTEMTTDQEKVPCAKCRTTISKGKEGTVDHPSMLDLDQQSCRK